MKISWSFWIICVAAILSTVGCAGIKEHNLPPAQQLLEPGPGVGGPGPGVIAPVTAPSVGMYAPAMEPTVQVLFDKPDGMQVRWDVSGIGQFDSTPLVVPGRHNFPQGGIYRLKLTNIPGHEGVERYPTIEIGPATPRSEAYLAHNAVPIQFTEEDFEQVRVGNYVTKVIYLPDPEFQELALANVDTLVSTRLDPGVDPIVEADRRGVILAVLRMGNKDVEMPGANDDAFGRHFGVPCDPQAMMMNPSAVPPYVSGVSGPFYGMPMSGTPIGLPGPPHIPLGSPAGLQKHIMKNHTHVNLPEPVEKFKINVRQQPGFSYPQPPSRMRIREQSIHASLPYGPTHGMQSEHVQ